MSARSTAPPPPVETARPDFAPGSVGALLGVFVAATLVMVVAVIAVGTVNQWWVLIPVMLLDLGVTCVVVAYIMRLLSDDGGGRA